MRALKVLALVAAIAVAIHWWRARAASIEAAAKDPNGFVSVIMAKDARENTVMIYAPLHCSSDAAQRSDSLAYELNLRRIPNARRDSFDLSVTNPTAEQNAAIQRTMDVINGGVPAVFINTRGKANPTLEEVVAEYSGSPQQRQSEITRR